jgi:hypothetical protein
MALNCPSPENIRRYYSSCMHHHSDSIVNDDSSQLPNPVRSDHCVDNSFLPDALGLYQHILQQPNDMRSQKLHNWTNLANGAAFSRPSDLRLPVASQNE